MNGTKTCYESCGWKRWRPAGNAFVNAEKQSWDYTITYPTPPSWHATRLVAVFNYSVPSIVELLNVEASVNFK